HRASDGKVSRDTEGAQATQKLLSAFLSHSPEPIATAKDLAEHMARLTHPIRDITVTAFARGEASNLVAGLHEAFQKTLVPDLKVPGFADMFAQTLAYGLFAARINHKGPEPFRRRDAAAEIPRTNPFLRQRLSGRGPHSSEQQALSERLGPRARKPNLLPSYLGQ
ncbi:MAG TPA: hypothetical protein VM221_01600, partial [Armatimonadota bacterium]|nr:hypothetical protein [Armatimonadota bacterium]